MKDNKTYSVYCHTCPDGMQYFGVTSSTQSRWKPSHYKRTSLEPYIEKYGWKNIKHEVLYSGLTRDEALKLEDTLIVEARNNGTCINMFRSGHYQQTDEFKEEQKVHKKVYKKAYYKAHNEECKARSKAYNEAHPEECKARSNAWHKAHNEECKAYGKAYYKAHPEECKARSKAWREAHPNYMREWRKRKKAEKQAQQSDVEKVKEPKPKRKKPLF